MLANPDAYLSHSTKKFAKSNRLHDTQHLSNLMIGSLDKHYCMKRDEVRKNYTSYLNNSTLINTFSSLGPESRENLRKQSLCHSQSIENFGLSESDAELCSSMVDKDTHTSSSHTSSVCESKNKIEKGLRKRFSNIEPLSDWLSKYFSVVSKYFEKINYSYLK
jgi:hypothetical protein